MEKKVAAVFDGTVFVPVEPIELHAGAPVSVTYYLAPPPPTDAERREAERLLRGDGTPLPWATVEEALGRPRYEP